MEFKHFLNFIEPDYGRIEITETVGFDASTFAVEQEKERFARDVTLGNEEVAEKYWRVNGQETDVPNILPSGEIGYFLTHQFDKLVESYKTKGTEAIVQRIIQKDGVDFVTGQLDFPTAKYNGRDEFICNTIQDTKRALFKRRSDIDLDMFATEDLDGNYSAPCNTVKVLLKAKPTFERSKWDSAGVTAIVSTGTTPFPAYFNGIKNIVDYGIQDTLTWFDDAAIYDFGASAYQGIPWGFQALRAKEELTNIKAKLNLNLITAMSTPVADSTVVRGYFMKGPEVDNIDAWFLLNSNLPRYEFYDTDILGIDSGNFLYEFHGEVNVDLPNMQAGEILYFFFVQSGNFATLVTSFGEENTVEITATSTAIDSVIDGVWVEDALKKCVDMTAESMALNAPLFDKDTGVHGQQVVVSGLLLRQATDRPFYLKSGEFFKSVTQEVCCDYKVRQNTIDIKRRSGATNSYYPNIEAGALLSAPEDNADGYLNPRYQLQALEYGYKLFEQERTEKDTLDEVATESQWMFPSRNVDEALKILISHFRGAFKFEALRKKAVTAIDNTSLADDNNYGILDLVELAPASMGTILRTLQMLGSGNTIKILSDGTFSWNLTGIGSTFSITEGNNQGAYTVTSIEPNMITATQSGLVTFTGNSLIKIEFFYEGVLWTNRTDENFSLIEGVKNPENYSNLLYTIGRNMRYWFPFMATAAYFNQDGTIKCQSFKNSKKTGSTFIPNITTIFNGGEEITDNANIPVVDLGTADVTPFVEEISLSCSFEQMLQICQNIDAEDGYLRYQRADGTIGKGYPTSMVYVWAEEYLDCTFEVKFEHGVVITSVSGGININGTYYLTAGEVYAKWFEIDNGYFQLYDNSDVLLFTPVLFNEVVINGNTYSDENDFRNVLLGLI